MSEIPGISIDGVDLESLQKDFPIQSKLIRELFARINDDDFDDTCLIQLCNLLSDTGNGDKSEQLLRLASKGNDIFSERYKQLHGNNVEYLFKSSINTFQHQFNVSLNPKCFLSWLSIDFAIACDGSSAINVLLPNQSDQTGSYGITIQMLDDKSIVGDLYYESSTKDTISVVSIPLDFIGGAWAKCC